MRLYGKWYEEGDFVIQQEFPSETSRPQYWIYLRHRQTPYYQKSFRTLAAARKALSRLEMGQTVRENPVRHKHKKSKHKSKHHKAPLSTKHTWWPWALAGLGGVGLIAYILLRPKTALAAGQSTPIIPGPGNIQISAGSRVPLIAPLRALVSQADKKGLTLTTPEYVNVPAKTVITIDQLDADGTIHFRYNGQALLSPVEVYSDVVSAPI